MCHYTPILATRRKEEAEEQRLTDISNDLSKLNISNEILRVKKLRHLVLCQTIHAWHLNINIIVSDSDGLAKL
jgi:hypothetical protein